MLLGKSPSLLPMLVIIDLNYVNAQMCRNCSSQGYRLRSTHFLVRWDFVWRGMVQAKSPRPYQSCSELKFGGIKKAEDRTESAAPNTRPRIVGSFGVLSGGGRIPM